MTLHENIVQGNCLAFYNKSLFGILKKCQQSTDIVEKKNDHEKPHRKEEASVYSYRLPDRQGGALPQGGRAGGRCGQRPGTGVP